MNKISNVQNNSNEDMMDGQVLLCFADQYE